MKKTALFLILLAVIAGGGWYFFAGAKPEQAMPPFGDSMKGPPMAVSTYEIQPENISSQYELPGRVTPYRQSQIRPQVDGIVTERLFEEGADVKKGDRLYQIDDARYKAALNSAIADLNSAKANVKSVKAKEERYKKLVKISAVSKQEYDDAKAQYDQANAAIAVAQAAVDVAQVNLDYTKVYAPINGRIGRSLVTEGALVTTNQADYLAVITQIDPVYIDMQQSGTQAMRLRNQMMGKGKIPVRLILDDQTGAPYPHKGGLEFSEITVDETTGSISLRALMPNPDGVLLTGLFVRAKIYLGTQSALLVPQRATSRDGKGLSVWVVDQNNQVQPRIIKASESYKSSWIVEEGLRAGDTIVVEGYQKLRPGMTVSASPWAPNADANVKQHNSQE